MKTLSEFLARRIIYRQDYIGPQAEKEYEAMIKWYGEDIAEGIEAYKEHLKNDSPKTVQWAMIEKKLITALEQMQSHNHLNEDCGCRPIGSPCIHNVKHPICPLNLYFEGDEIKLI